MRKVRTLQTNFASGQLDPLMAARTDTKAYANGAETLTNVMQLVQGGVKRRMGMEYLAEIGEHARLIPFVFNEDQLYLFAMYYDSGAAEGRIKVYDPDGVLLTTVTGLDWNATNLETVRYTQRNDVIIFTHEDFPMTIVTRTGASSFTAAYFDFDADLSGGKLYAPMYAFQKYDTSITPSATTGNITLVTSANHWTADHVGARVSIHGRQCEVTGFTNAQLVTATVQEDLFTDQQLTISTAANFQVGEVVTQTNSEAEGEVVEIDAGGTWIKVANLKKTPFVTQTTSDATVGGLSGAEGQVSAIADVGPLPTRDWKEEVFSYARGWARSCLFHGQRLWFGGSRDLPAHLFSSKISNFFNFDTGEALDDESIQAPIASDQVNSIRYLVSAGHLQIFTDQAEFYCPESENAPLVPADFNIRRQSSYGCANVRPLPFDRATLFVQSTGKVVREYKWEEIEGGYTPNAISLIASNLLDSSGIVDTAVVYGLKNRPEQYAFFLNNDGTIAVYHAARNEQISSWCKWETNGKIIHICGMEGILYAVVERSIGGSTVTTLERFTEDVTLDCAKRYTSPSTTNTFTQTHLPEDTVVSIVSDYEQSSSDAYQSNAYYVGEQAIQLFSSTPKVIGVDLPDTYEVYSIVIGFNFDTTIKTMPVDYAAADGQITGLPKKISTIDVLLDSTLAAEVQGVNLILRNVTDDLSLPPPPFTGRKRFYTLGWDRYGQIEVKSTAPLNFTLLGLMLEVSF